MWDISPARVRTYVVDPIKILMIDERFNADGHAVTQTMNVGSHIFSKCLLNRRGVMGVIRVNKKATNNYLKTKDVLRK